MDNTNQEQIEREFLSILINEPKIGFDLLQYIKPKCLEIKSHQEIFETLLIVKKKYGLVTTSSFYEEIPKHSSLSIEEIADIITQENIPVTDIRKQFMIAQKVILDNYKTKVIANLTQKLNSKQIDCDKYLNEMAKINEIVIKDETSILDEEEILNNINLKNVGINLNNFPQLNETLNLVQGDFLIIGANTGAGKSGLMLNLMNELMNNYQCIYFNMEMSKSTIYKRMIAIKSNIPVYDAENPQSEMQKQVRDNAIKEIVSKQVAVEHKASYLDEIKKVIAIHKNDAKHTIIFLDHIGLIKTSNKKSIYEQTTEVAKLLRQLCLDYNCTIISACQLNRSSYNSQGLNLTMLKDSGELENSASKVILLYKNKEKISQEKYVDNMVLDIVKNRDGRIGKISCTYDKIKQIFKEEKIYEQ